MLRRMQQFILEEQLEVICEAAGIAWEEVQELDKEEFILVMLQIHQANSSRKWRLMIKNSKMEKSDLSLNTLVEVMAAARADLATYREFLEISERVKKPEVKKDFKERPHYVASATHKNFPSKTFSGSSPVSTFASNKSGKEKN